MRRRLAIAAAVLALLAALGLAAWRGALRRLGPPDVILITIDTLRWDHVSAFDPASPARTPHIDTLAADGVAYTQAWSPISVTGPAFTSVMTGQDPGTHGVLLNLFRGGATLPPSATTLAEQLADRRFVTGAFVSGFTLRRALGLAQGFQRYDGPSAGERRRPGRRTARRALDWLATQPRWRPALLWVHSYDPHGPLTPYVQRAPVDGRWERDPQRLPHLPLYQRIDDISDPLFYRERYAEAVEAVDAQVGELLAALRAAGRYDHALIVFLSDHGETFTERPLWFDHGTHASAEQLHVPLIVKYPQGRGAGTRVDALVSLVDVLPTVLDELGLPLPADLDGRSLRDPGHDQLLGESSHCKRAPVLDCAPPGPGGKELSLRSPTAAFLRRPTVNGVVYEHHDRATDPAEQGPGDAPLPAEVQARLDALAADRAGRGLADPTLPGVEEGEEDAEELEALRALGYVE